MMRLRMPPRVKVLEAASSLADGRVVFLRDEGGVFEARVSSSLGDRVYRVVVKVNPDGSLLAYSSDNGTRLRGYIGYPIIAVLMAKNMLPRSPEAERALAGIPWRELNEKLKSYERVVEEVAGIAEKRGLSRRELESFMEKVVRALQAMRVYYVEL